MLNCHTLNVDVSDEAAEAIIASSECKTFEEFMADINTPVPRYVQVYNFVCYRIPCLISEAMRDLRDRWQRGCRGYSNRDVWNTYVYLSEIISGMSGDLANETHGYPPELSAEEWDTVLRTIQKGFARVGEIEDSAEDLTDDDMQHLNEAFDLLKKYFIYMWD